MLAHVSSFWGLTFWLTDGHWKELTYFSTFLSIFNLSRSVTFLNIIYMEDWMSFLLHVFRLRTMSISNAFYFCIANYLFVYFGNTKKLFMLFIHYTSDLVLVSCIRELSIFFLVDCGLCRTVETFLLYIFSDAYL